MIPVFRPSLGEEELNSIRETFNTGWIGLGPRTAEFEKLFADYVSVKNAIGLNSCTAALHLVLKGFGITSGEILVPSLTFVSTAHAALYNNAKPVFVDVYEDNLCMNVDDMQEKITNKTKAIISVDYGGHPCDIDAILEIAREKKIIVIEDAAQSCGAEYKGNKVGSLVDATCFSFEAKKNLTTGDGGMLTTDNGKVADKIKKLRWVGINKNTWERSNKGYFWHYEVVDVGYKYHMSDIQAAIGIVQLKKLDKLNKIREEIAEFFNKNFSKIHDIKLLKERDYVRSAHWNYVIKVQERDKFISFMKENEIETSVHYMPVHLHPIYKKFKAKVPVTEEVWKTIVTLPSYPTLTQEELEKIVYIVKKFFEQGGKEK